ncbi:hypothetical protein CMI37_37685 [Candidatus Pacearchaeota archaeon]|nr:hypothetical protein [Candidatus Pacearchaeota archaeon]|tara:strand:- start:1909 stop:2451 length:543 start_codon:yes stop_codon:yes gene_type:complete
MDKKLRVIGLYHNILHPDYGEYMDHIEKVVNEDDIVSIESPLSLEDIFFKGNSDKSPQYGFLFYLCNTLQDIGANFNTIEDIKQYGKRARLMQWYMYDGREELESDHRWQRANIKASIGLYDLALSSKSDFLITGIMHAYDLQQMGYPNVELFSDIPDKVRDREDEWIRKWGIVYNGDEK